MVDEYLRRSCVVVNCCFTQLVISVLLIFLVLVPELVAQSNVTTTGGTTNAIPKFTGIAAIGNSSITDSGGNVGIGTSTPAATLDVNGDAMFRTFVTSFTTTGNNGPQLAFTNAASPAPASWRIGVPGSANSTSFFLFDYLNENSPFTVEKGAGANSLYLRSGGNVGIGTASPAYKLDVNGSIRIQGGGGLFFPNGTVQYTAAPGGTITGVLPGSGLVGGGYIDNVYLSVDSTVARTNGANTYTSQQTFTNYPLFVNNTAVLIDNLQYSQYGVRSTVLSGIAGGFWNKAWYDTSWGTGSIIAGWAGSGQTQMFRVDTRGTTYTYNSFVPGGYDYAELVTATRVGEVNYEPGDVLVIDNAENSHFILSSEKYSRLVAGVFSTKPGVLASSHPMEPELKEDEVPLALLGQVDCKVSAENGSIRVGDLLVTSSTVGHAMRADDDARPGTILGKALEPLPFGTGKIKILLTLQ